jgi:hypothetical protein
MPEIKRPQKNTLAEMRAANMRGLLIYCSDYHCSHWTTLSADRWPDNVRLIWSESLPARLAAERVLTSGRISAPKLKPGARRLPLPPP